MSGTTKNIAEMTDDEIDALSVEEMEALQHGGAAASENDGDGETGDGDGADGGDGGSEDGNSGADDAGGEGDGEGLTAEQLEAIANDGNGMVPLARLNEILARDRQKDELIAQLVRERGSQTPAQNESEPDNEPPAEPSYDFKAAQREMLKLMSEGDDEAAAAKAEEIEDKREEINQFRLNKAREEATETVRREFGARQVRSEIEQTEADLSTRYPFLNNKDKTANRAAILAVNAEAKALIKEGKTPAEALREAGEAIGSQFAKVLGVSTDATSGRQNNAPAPGQDPRTKAAIARNLNLRQPPQAQLGVGNRERAANLDVANMTDEQLEAAMKSGELDDLLAGARA